MTTTDALMRDAHFLRAMAIILLLMTIAGFAPRYLVPLAHGTYDPPTAWNQWMHPHAIAGFGFSLLFIIQPSLILSRKFAAHRLTGYGAAAIVALSLISGIGVQMGMYPTTADDLSNIMGGAFRLFLSLPMMVAFFIAAWSLKGRPDWHWRFMYMAAFAPVGTILGRLYQYYLPVHEDAIGPLVGLGNLLFVLVLPISDKFRHGSIHKASWISLGVFIALQIVVAAMLGSGWWGSVATNVG